MNSLKRVVSTLKKSFFFTALPCLGGIFLTLSTAWAGSLIFDGARDNCTQFNCGAVSLNGISQRNAFGDSIPFTAELFADPGECMRLDVVSETADMEIVLVSPSGRVWRNDDFNGNRPLIMAHTDVKGYYTVQINHFSGLPNLNTLQLFTLAYGRYVRGTANNCPSQTTPFSIRDGNLKSELPIP